MRIRIVLFFLLGAGLVLFFWFVAPSPPVQTSLISTSVAEASIARLAIHIHRNEVNGDPFDAYYVGETLKVLESFSDQKRIEFFSLLISNSSREQYPGQHQAVVILSALLLPKSLVGMPLSMIIRDGNQDTTEFASYSLRKISDGEKLELSELREISKRIKSGKKSKITVSDSR